ncbi:hypothetical protein [Alkalihalobacillus sp. TS-13]|uniref:hypothetical protein n=1 Tax=Alkalihalobacillus sp. TS-13 TaxID=2842455 RepID=UPI001C87DA5B|nr:hypothetical protein [Alkalihalobacillus sp. TS-13]
MKKWIAGLVALLVISSGYFAYGKMTDDTYEGMSIVPENRDDLPLYKGLEPNRNSYTIEGDHWENIYKYYLEELPEDGWMLGHDDSALDDTDAENDWSGFRSTWIKDGFDGELHLSASYNEHNDETEVNFDKTMRHISTEWIGTNPETVCIYEKVDDQECRGIEDEESVEEIVRLINSSLDWNDAIEPREKKSLLEIGGLKVEVHYESDSEVYLRSHKGIKIMKPEPEFFEHTKLSVE